MTPIECWEVRIENRNKIGSRRDPCETPAGIGNKSENLSKTEVQKCLR